MQTSPGALLSQLLLLVIFAVPVASVSWTVTHEAIFAEAREWCERRSRRGPLLRRKFFYVFTCEYCFSHWVTLALLVVTGFRMVYGDWRGYVVAGFATVWLANVFMSLYGRLRLDIKHERHQIAAVEQELKAPVRGDDRG